MRRVVLSSVVAAGVALAPGVAGASAALGYVSSAPAAGAVTVVDARAQAACLAKSVRGAHCLPAADFLGPHGRLASFRQIFWLLGTAGLSGREHVLVVGDDPVERDFVAGMLYLSGQRKVSILTRAVSQGTGLAPDALGPGTPRAMVRNPIYQGAVRGDDIVLRTELARMLAAHSAPAMLDGRSDAEYWGERIRAWRGGHLPGAQSLPIGAARRELAGGHVDLPAGKSFVVYGHDAFESVAYFTLLRAAGTDARVLLDGWAGWANHPDLPVASETYPDRAAAPVLRVPEPSRWLLSLTLFNLLAVLSLAGGLAYAWKRKS